MCACIYIYTHMYKPLLCALATYVFNDQRIDLQTLRKIYCNIYILEFKKFLNVLFS